VAKTNAVRDVALAIQAGGSSRRMGEDKAFLDFGGVPLLEWILERVSHIFEYTFVVANEVPRYRPLGLPVVTDAVLGAGAAGGIYSAVLAAPAGRVLSLGCDMPFVPPALLRELAASASGYDVVVPRHGEHLQPLCAVYGPGAADALEALLQRGQRKVDSVFREVDTKYVDVGDGRFGDPEAIFLNVNTLDDLARAEELLEAGYAEDTRAVSSPRVRDFQRRVGIPVVSFVGKKKSGKTTVLLGVIQELLSRGLRVGTIKHDTHDFEIDAPGTDSYRLHEVGAHVSGISGPHKYVYVNRVTQERTLEDLVRGIPEPVDIVLTEGFKREAAPKIEVSREERSTSLIAEPEELIALVADHDGPRQDVPRLEMDDYAGIVNVLVDFVYGLGSD